MVADDERVWAIVERDERVRSEAVQLEIEPPSTEFWYHRDAT